jgi:N-acetyl-anhydromuramyl-L-alanine amidase AmpD
MELPVIISAPSPNHGDRRGAIVECVVLHTTEGTAPSALDWFARLESKASAHFVIGHDGQIYRCVSEDLAAWHAGNPAVNRASIGIELEGRCADPGNFTAPMMDSLGALCRYLVERYRLPVDRQHLFGHCDVPDPDHPGEYGGHSHHHDPGPLFNWADLFDRLQSFIPPAPAGPAGTT